MIADSVSTRRQAPSSCPQFVAGDGIAVDVAGSFS